MKPYQMNIYKAAELDFLLKLAEKYAISLPNKTEASVRRIFGRRGPKAEDLSREELYVLAQSLGHKGISRLKREELLDLLIKPEEKEAPQPLPIPSVSNVSGEHKAHRLPKRHLEEEKKAEPRRGLPLSTRLGVWRIYIGDNKLEGSCCCCGTSVTRETYECGHIKAAAEGGGDDLQNLRPLCRTCNRSMGTTPMLAFMIASGYDKTNPEGRESLLHINDWSEPHEYKGLMLAYRLRLILGRLEAKTALPEEIERLVSKGL